MKKYLLLFFFLALYQISVSSVKNNQHRFIQTKISTQVQANSHSQQQGANLNSLQQIFDAIESISTALSQMSKTKMTLSEMIKANVTTDLMAGNPDNIKNLTVLIQKLYNVTVTNGYYFYMNNTFADEETLNKTLKTLISLQDQVDFITKMVYTKFGNTTSQIKDFNCRNNLIKAQGTIADTYKLFLAAYGKGMQTQEYKIFADQMKNTYTLGGSPSFISDSFAGKNSYCQLFDILLSGSVSKAMANLPVMMNMANAYLLTAYQGYMLQIVKINSEYIDISRSDRRVNYSASLQSESYQIPYNNAFKYHSYIQDWANMTKINIRKIFCDFPRSPLDPKKLGQNITDTMALIKPGFNVDVHLFSDNTNKAYPDGRGSRMAFFSATQINNREEQRQFYFAITIAPKDDCKNYTSILDSKYTKFRDYLNNNQQQSTATMNANALRVVNADGVLDGAMVFWNWEGYYPTKFEFPNATLPENKYNYLNGRMACEHQYGFGFCIHV